MLDFERAVRQVLRWLVTPTMSFILANARCAGAFTWVVIYWIVLWRVQPQATRYLGTLATQNFGPLYIGFASGLLVLSGIVALCASERRKSIESRIRTQANAIADALVFRRFPIMPLNNPSKEKSILDLVITEARNVGFGEHRDPEELCILLRKLREIDPDSMTASVEVAFSGLTRARMREDYGPTDLRFTWTAILFAFIFTVLCVIFRSESDNVTFALGALLATTFAVNNCFLLIDERYI